MHINQFSVNSTHFCSVILCLSLCVSSSLLCLHSSSSLFSLLFCPLPASLCSADPEWSLHDSTERPCSGLYIWGCHVRFSGAAKLGDAFKSQQLPLPWAKAYSVCGLAGLPAERVGDFTQLPQGLHLTCEYTSSLPWETHLNQNLCSTNEALTFWVTCTLKSWEGLSVWFDHTLLNWMITPWERRRPPPLPYPEQWHILHIQNGVYVCCSCSAHHRWHGLLP